MGAAFGVVREGGTVSRVGAPQYPDVPAGYQEMAGCTALEVLIRP